MKKAMILIPYCVFLAVSFIFSSFRKFSMAAFFIAFLTFIYFYIFHIRENQSHYHLFSSDKKLQVVWKYVLPILLFSIIPLSITALKGARFHVPTTIQEYLFTIVTVIFTPPIEEFFFRYFLVYEFRDNFLHNRGISAVVQVSIVFSIIHLIQFYNRDIIVTILIGNIVVKYLFSLFFFHVKKKTGTIWGPIIVHSAINLCAVFNTLVLSLFAG